LEVDGEAEVVVRINETEKITFFVVSCNPPIVCSEETVNLISSESLKRGSKVEVSAYLLSFPRGSMYIIEKSNGYIKKNVTRCSNTVPALRAALLTKCYLKTTVSKK
jgi:hypothetical protein